MTQILIVERDSASADQLLLALGRAGYQLRHTADYRAALAAPGVAAPDVVLAVAHGDIEQVLPILRAAEGQPPRPAVLVLGERRYDLAVAAFRAGAADYLHLPCAPETLAEAVEAAIGRRSRLGSHTTTLRRLQEQLAEMQEALAALEAPAQRRERGDEAAREQSVHLVVGRIAVGRNRRQVLLDGQALAVTPIEYRLLRCLSETPGEAVSFRQIVAQTHAYEASETEAASMLKSHLRNLRRKLPYGSLVTIRGAGLALTNVAGTSPEEELATLELA